MREVTFVSQNIDKWKKFEDLLQSKDNHNPDEISSLYVDVIDDLSYSRTFYPKSPTSKYLNELTGKAHQVIYKNKKERGSRIIKFWKTELPSLFYYSQKQFLISFLVFAISAVVGIVSAANDDTFVRLIMGDNYVNTTIENIKNGNPLGIYASASAMYMFIAITTNNILVGLKTFAVGIFFSIGTVLFLFYNGVMLGTFEYFLYQYGALQESLFTIWLHGVIEISVIIVCGAAGLVLGNSVLFPGTYSRMESFKAGAKQGMKITFGTVPFFITAGFIESFITRHARFSHFFDAVLISLSLILIIGYFVIYPIWLHKKAEKEINTTTP